MSRLFYRGDAERIADAEERSRALANADRSANRATLRPLKDLQLIQAVRPWLRSAGGGLCRRETNVLTAGGAGVLEAYYDEEGKGRPVRWSPSVMEIDGTNQAHAEAIVDVYVAVKRAVAPPLLFWGWKDDRELARLSDEGATLLRTGIPDAVFVLTRVDGGQKEHVPFFVEVDRGTETVWSGAGRGRDWKGKIERYEAYFAGPYFRDPHFRGLDRLPTVLCVATAARRLENLLEATAAVTTSRRYAFTTLEALHAEGLPRIRERTIWRRTHEASFRCLGDLLDRS